MSHDVCGLNMWDCDVGCGMTMSKTKSMPCRMPVCRHGMRLVLLMVMPQPTSMINLHPYTKSAGGWAVPGPTNEVYHSNYLKIIDSMLERVKSGWDFGDVWRKIQKFSQTRQNSSRRARAALKQIVSSRCVKFRLGSAKGRPRERRRGSPPSRSG